MTFNPDAVKANPDPQAIQQAVAQALKWYKEAPQGRQYCDETWTDAEVDGVVYSIHIEPSVTAWVYLDAPGPDGQLRTHTEVTLAKATVLDEQMPTVFPEDLALMPNQKTRPLP